MNWRWTTETLIKNAYRGFRHVRPWRRYRRNLIINIGILIRFIWFNWTMRQSGSSGRFSINAGFRSASIKWLPTSSLLWRFLQELFQEWHLTTWSVAQDYKMENNIYNSDWNTYIFKNQLLVLFCPDCDKKRNIFEIEAFYVQLWVVVNCAFRIYSLLNFVLSCSFFTSIHWNWILFNNIYPNL